MDQPDADRAGQGDRSRVREHLSTWQPTAVSIVLIMVMRPSPKLPHIRHVDKYLHALASGILAVLSCRSSVKTGVRSGALSTFLLGLVVGMSYEGGQALGRVRTADRYDLVADEIGTIIGMLIFALSLRPGADLLCLAQRVRQHKLRIGAHSGQRTRTAAGLSSG